MSEDLAQPMDLHERAQQRAAQLIKTLNFAAPETWQFHVSEALQDIAETALEVHEAEEIAAEGDEGFDEEEKALEDEKWWECFFRAMSFGASTDNQKFDHDWAADIADGMIETAKKRGRL